MKDATITLEEIHSLEKQGLFEQALRHGKMLLAEYHAPKIPFSTLAPLLLTLARLAAKLQSEECLYFVELALKRKTKSKEGLNWIATILVVKALFLKNQGKITEALEEYDKAAAYGEVCKDKDNNLLAYIYSGRAQCAALRSSRQFELDRAEKLLKESIAFCESHSIPYFGDRLMLASLYIDVQQPSKALPIIDTLLDECSPDSKTTAHKTIASTPKANDLLQYFLTAKMLKTRCLLTEGKLLEALTSLVEATRLHIETNADSLPQYIFAFYSICCEAGYFDDVYETQRVTTLLFETTSFTMSDNLKLHLLMGTLRTALRQKNMPMLVHYWSIAEESIPGLSLTTHFYNINVATIEILLAQKKIADARSELDRWKAMLTPDSFSWQSTAHELEAACISMEESLPYCERIANIHRHWQEVDAISLDPLDKLEIRGRYLSRLQVLHNLQVPDSEKAEIEQKCAALDEIFTITAEEEPIFRNLIANFKLLLYTFAQEQWAEKCNLQKEQLKIAEETIAHYKDAVYQQEKAQRKIIQSIKRYSIDCLEENWSVRTIQKKMIELLDDFDEKTPMPPSVNVSPSTLPSPIVNALMNISPSLSEKEVVFCWLLMDGKQVDFIAEAIGIKQASLKKFRYRLCRKLKVPKGEQLLYFLRKLIKITD